MLPHEDEVDEWRGERLTRADHDGGPLVEDCLGFYNGASRKAIWVRNCFAIPTKAKGPSASANNQASKGIRPKPGATE
jgi:hypothetical protein